MKCKIILEVLGLVVALVGLAVSCTALSISKEANQISKANQKQIERLECFDKVGESSNELIEPYGKALDNATRIHNYFPEKIDVSQLHSEFQAKAIEALRLKKSLLGIVNRYGFKCSEKAIAVMSDIADLSTLRKGSDYYDSFGGFNSQVQDRHHQNFDWLLNTDVANECCSGPN